MGVLRRMGRAGDVPTMWELDDAGSIRVAQERFDEAIGRRMLAFNLTDAPGEQIKQFDPAAKEIVLIPPIAGG